MTGTAEPELPGETVGEVYYWAEHHPQAPALGPDRHGLIWLPEEENSYG